MNNVYRNFKFYLHIIYFWGIEVTGQTSTKYDLMEFNTLEHGKKFV